MINHACRNKPRSAERGNVLWFILVGVALLGILTMVLSRGGSSTDQTGDFERQSVEISEMLRYAKSLEAAIQEMRLRGVAERNLSFENTTTVTDYTNSRCDDASDASFPDCLLFDVQGAGLDYIAPPGGLNDGSEWIFSGTNDIAGVGTTAPDLVMLLPRVNQGTCTQINRLLSKSFSGNDSDIDFTAFTGTYTATETIGNAASQSAGCTIHDNTGTDENLFYYVLIPR